MNFTANDVVTAMTRVVEEAGEDYIYPQLKTCRYADNGQPSCIVGKVIAALSPETFNAIALDEEENTRSLIVTMLEARTGIPMPFTKAALTALGVAQEVQDSHQPWGDALEAAVDTKNKARNLGVE